MKPIKQRKPLLIKQHSPCEQKQRSDLNRISRHLHINRTELALYLLQFSYSDITRHVQDRAADGADNSHECLLCFGGAAQIA